MAANKVLQLPELLEPILLDLSTRDLLFAQKVCTTWKTTVDKSQAIQRALFLMLGAVDDVDTNSNCRTSKVLPGSEVVAINSLLINTSVAGRKGALVISPQDLNINRSCSRLFLTQSPITTRLSVDVATVATSYEERTGGLRLSSDDTFASLVKQYLALVKDIGDGYFGFDRASIELLLASPQAWAVGQWRYTLNGLAKAIKRELTEMETMIGLVRLAAVCRTVKSRVFPTKDAALMTVGSTSAHAGLEVDVGCKDQGIAQQYRDSYWVGIGSTASMPLHPRNLVT
ncbi:hypothetical protein LTR15_002635 [Elasticomyces elasticus]|nr:hypothetical protein LTR15_002635 [Elasticomyces elasticus]